MEKALGATQYVGDMHVPGMLHARVLWAGVPHAIIRGIDISEAQTMPGVRAVLTAADIPGTNRYGLCRSGSARAGRRQSPHSRRPPSPLWPPKARSRQKRL